MCKSALPVPIHQSIPLLVATASLRSEIDEQIRLINLSCDDGAAISAAVGLPRVSVLGIDVEAPGAGSLIQYVRQQIEPVRVPWMRGSLSASYLPVGVNAEESVVGLKDSRKRKADAQSAG